MIWAGILLISTFGMGISATAADLNSSECFKAHLTEARDLNQKRRPLYARASQGRSQSVSKALIQMEEQMLFFSSLLMNFDRMSRPYLEKGISITCDAYVPMSKTPKFLFQDPRGPLSPAEREAAPRAKEVIKMKRLEAAFDQSLDLFARELDWQIHQLEKEPRLNCLSRHFLESMARIARLAPLHETAAKKAGLESPTFIHRRMIRGHLLFMKTAISIDEEAKALQVEGLPIICRDVPPIPYRRSQVSTQK